MDVQQQEGLAGKLQGIDDRLNALTDVVEANTAALTDLKKLLAGLGPEVIEAMTHAAYMRGVADGTKQRDVREVNAALTGVAPAFVPIAGEGAIAHIEPAPDVDPDSALTTAVSALDRAEESHADRAASNGFRGPGRGRTVSR